jgi:hypothetical protein
VHDWNSLTRWARRLHCAGFWRGRGCGVDLNIAPRGGVVICTGMFFNSIIQVIFGYKSGLLTKSVSIWRHLQRATIEFEKGNGNSIAIVVGGIDPDRDRGWSAESQPSTALAEDLYQARHACFVGGSALHLSVGDLRLGDVDHWSAARSGVAISHRPFDLGDGLPLHTDREVSRRMAQSVANPCCHFLIDVPGRRFPLNQGWKVDRSTRTRLPSPRSVQRGPTLSEGCDFRSGLRVESAWPSTRMSST